VAPEQVRDFDQLARWGAKSDNHWTVATNKNPLRNYNKTWL